MASGLRICFPAPGLKEREGVREEKEDVELDRQLASFSLNLGPTAANLVVSLITPGLLEREAEVKMLVSLPVDNDWPGDPLMLRCSQLVLDKCGGLIMMTEPRISQAWEEEEEVKVTYRPQLKPKIESRSEPGDQPGFPSVNPFLLGSQPVRLRRHHHRYSLQQWRYTRPDSDEVMGD